jgi:hypothetical protein
VAAVSAARRGLVEVARTLLDAGAGPPAWRSAVQALFRLCGEHGGFVADPRAPAEPAATPLAEGIALAPCEAASCILDSLRTTRFLRGVAAAVEAARRRFGEPVEVLYAGCGPFAPLFFPLTALTGANRARFTLLDAHAASIACVRRLAAAFGAAPRLRAAEVADACAWRAPRAPHVIVAEVMQAGLAQEPQVAVMRALAPQLAPGGFFVPEQITLGVCLADLAREFAQDADGAGGEAAPARVALGAALRLRAGELRRGLPRDAEPRADWPVAGHGKSVRWRALPTLRLSVPDHTPRGLHALALTHVRIFGPLALAEGDSGLTVPRVLHVLGRVAPGSTLEFRYLLGAHPRLDARAVG